MDGNASTSFLGLSRQSVPYDFVLCSRERVKEIYSIHVGSTTSLVPKPSLTAFFAAVEKINRLIINIFSTAAKKSCEERPG